MNLVTIKWYMRRATQQLFHSKKKGTLTLTLLGFVCSHLGSFCQSCTYLHNCFRRNMVFTWEASGHIGDGWKSCASSGGQGSCGVNGRWSHLAQVGWVRLVVGPRRGWLCLPGVWKIRERTIKKTRKRNFRAPTVEIIERNEITEHTHISATRNENAMKHNLLL